MTWTIASCEVFDELIHAKVDGVSGTSAHDDRRNAAPECSQSLGGGYPRKRVDDARICRSTGCCGENLHSSLEKGRGGQIRYRHHCNPDCAWVGD